MRLSELRTGEKRRNSQGFRSRWFLQSESLKWVLLKEKPEVILNAPLKDPIKYRLLGYEISPKTKADMIEVVSEQEARTMQNPTMVP